MRNDQLPQENAESERTPNVREQSFMDYTPLVILQQRLNALENSFGDQYPHDDSILAPRIARVAPMSSAPESTRGRLPPINYQAHGTVDISALHLPIPTAATFSNATAAVAAAAAAHDTAVQSGVHVASHSASFTTASSNTATYASPPLNYTTTHPSLYCIAATSGNGYYGSPSASNSDTDSATSTETATASEHDYDTIPPFSRRALYSYDISAATPVIRRRVLGSYDDETMDEGQAPRKAAKRSVHHVTAVNGSGNSSGNDSGDGFGDGDGGFGSRNGNGGFVGRNGTGGFGGRNGNGGFGGRNVNGSIGNGGNSHHEMMDVGN